MVSTFLPNLLLRKTGTESVIEGQEKDIPFYAKYFVGKGSI